MGEPQTIRVEVVYALPRCQHSLFLDLPPGSTVQAALDMAAQKKPFSQLDLTRHAVGIYAEIITDRKTVLSAGNRLEIYRSLEADPMQQRLERAKEQALSQGKKPG